MEASDDSIYMIDRSHRYIFANYEHISRLAEDGKISGRSKSEVVGKRYENIHSGEELENFKENILKVFETGEPWTEEYEFLVKGRWSSRTYSPIVDRESEEVEAVVVVSKDITERKKAEEREEFLHSLLGHDVGNKAQIVRVYLELAEEHDLSEEVRGYLAKARKAAQNGLDIIEKVRLLREIEKEETGVVSIDPVIKSVVEENLASVRDKNIEIEMAWPNFDCKIQGGSLLNELFTNLIGNSIKHSGGSKIRISGEELEDEIIFSIDDDGKGIPGDVREKIFEKGFKSGKTAGSGLGLFLVRRIAEIYGGKVELEDSELGGARFDVHLRKA